MVKITFTLLLLTTLILGINSIAFSQEEAVNVGNKICPVSGEEIGETAMEPATYEYEGKIYNFCCPMCVEDFKKDPQKYIKKVEEELSSQPQAQPEESSQHEHHH